MRTIPCIALAAASLAVTSVAMANSGTVLSLDEYQAGTEVTNSTIVQNGGFENVDGTGEPLNWTKVGTFRADTPIGPNVSAVNGSKAAQGPLNTSITDDDGAPNKYVQNINLPAGSYYISAYLWNFSGNYDLTVAEALGPTPGVSQSLSLVSDYLGVNGARGVFAYGQFSTGGGAYTVEAEFDIDVQPQSGGPHTVPFVAGQIDNVSITPASQFQAPIAVPEPASASLLVLGAAGLLRRRRI